MKVNLEKRIARVEAICDKTRSAEDDVQEKALQTAIDADDEILAAQIARTIRNKLLQESDGKLAFDRCGLDLPDTISATTMLTVFKNLVSGIKTLIDSDWAKYRQALRDLPEQSGFPFNITWPEAPDSVTDDE